MSAAGDAVVNHRQVVDSSGYPGCLQEDWDCGDHQSWTFEAETDHAEHVAEQVLAAIMPLREVDVAQRLVLTLGEHRYPVRSLEKAGDRITLTAQLEEKS